MKRSRKSPFKFTYFIYLCLLIVLAIAAIFYVSSLLKNYESSQPENRVEDAIELFVKDAKSGKLWDHVTFPKVNRNKFEEDVDYKEAYTKLITDGELEYSPKAGLHDEGELVYTVKRDGFAVAEVALKAKGEPVTKLAVFTIQDWTIDKVTPIFEEHSYTLSVPTDLTVTVNGIKLTESDGNLSGEHGIDYKISGMYLIPEISITDTAGNKASYVIDGNKIIPELYNYSLTLPSTLKVELNGQTHEGEVLEDGNVKHDIRLLTKPNVKIADLYGNVVNYEGGNDLPLTYMSITASDDYTVSVNGSSVPTEAVSAVVNVEYETFKDYVTDLPENSLYNIAILKNDCEITVKDADGNAVDFDASVKALDLTKKEGLESVPENISAELDVLKIAENWSLFMSNDLPFYTLAQDLIASSYQYEVATKYANGIDITFTSIHTLYDPPFVDENVTNFVQITENFFSVDISFTKRMLLSNGETVEDSMNERCYFVKYDDTADYVDNPTWKLLSMKEIVGDAE